MAAATSSRQRMTPSMEKRYDDPETGTVIVRKNPRSRRMTLRVSPRGGVVVTIPHFVRYISGLEFFQAKKDWVLKVRQRQSERIGSGHIPAPEEIEALRKAAKEFLPKRLRELAETHSFEYNSVRIKHNSSNWGSCSHKGNINLNLNLMRLPDELRDYVILHELCHLRHPDHGFGFHALLESICPGHLAKQRELRNYSLY